MREHYQIYLSFLVLLALTILSSPVYAEETTGQIPEPFGRIYLLLQRTNESDLDKPNNDIYFKAINLGLKGRLTDYLRYRTQIKLDKKSLKFTPLDAYCAVGLLPFAELRIGQFKPPFSMERLIPSPKRDFVGLAMASRLSSSRDIGIALLGETNRIQFGAGILNGAGSNTPEDNSKKDLVGRLIFKPLNGTKLGGAIYWGWQGPDADIAKKRRYNLQAELKYPEFHIRGEYTYAKDAEIERDASYVQTSYKLVVNNKRLKSVEPLVRWERYDGPNDGDQEDNLTIVTLGTNLYFYDHKFKSQVNYLLERSKASGTTTHELYIGLQIAF